MIFYCIGGCVSVCGYVQVNASACGGQRLQMPLGSGNCEPSDMVLGTELRSSV